MVCGNIATIGQVSFKRILSMKQIPQKVLQQNLIIKNKLYCFQLIFKLLRGFHFFLDDLYCRTKT